MSRKCGRDQTDREYRAGFTRGDDQMKKELNVQTNGRIPEKALFTCLFASYWGFYAAYINYAATFFLDSGISSGKSM